MAENNQPPNHNPSAPSDLELFTQLAELVSSSKFTSMSEKEREDFIKNELSTYPPALQEQLLLFYQGVMEEAEKIERTYEESIVASFDEYKAKTIAALKQKYPKISAGELQAVEEKIEQDKKAKLFESKLDEEEIEKAAKSTAQKQGLSIKDLKHLLILLINIFK